MDENYIGLKAILDEAFERASSGKGKERHANDKPFEQQWIIQGALKHGTGALLFQIEKKLNEASRLGPEAGDRELLDVIVYTAADIIVRRMLFGSVEKIVDKLEARMTLPHSPFGPFGPREARVVGKENT